MKIKELFEKLLEEKEISASERAEEIANQIGKIKGITVKYWDKKSSIDGYYIFKNNEKIATLSEQDDKIVRIVKSKDVNDIFMGWDINKIKKWLGV